jgi:hypothetical protein
VKRDLKNWCITKELALDRRVEASNSCARRLIFGSFSFINFLSSFFHPFSLTVLLPFLLFFDLGFPSVFPFHFRSCFVPILLAHVVSSLAYSNLSEN